MGKQTQRSNVKKKINQGLGREVGEMIRNMDLQYIWKREETDIRVKRMIKILHSYRENEKTKTKQAIQREDQPQ